MHAETKHLREQTRDAIRHHPGSPLHDAIEQLNDLTGFDAAGVPPFPAREYLDIENALHVLRSFALLGSVDVQAHEFVGEILNAVPIRRRCVPVCRYKGEPALGRGSFGAPRVNPILEELTSVAGSLVRAPLRHSWEGTQRQTHAFATPVVA